MRALLYAVAIAVVTLALAACDPPTPTTIAPTSTAPPTPVAAPTPTATPAPSTQAAPFPTVTPPPTPTPRAHPLHPGGALPDSNAAACSYASAHPYAYHVDASCACFYANSHARNAGRACFNTDSCANAHIQPHTFPHPISDRCSRHTRAQRPGIG